MDLDGDIFFRNIISNSMERLGKSSNYMVDFHMIGVEKGQAPTSPTVWMDAFEFQIAKL